VMSLVDIQGATLESLPPGTYRTTSAVLEGEEPQVATEVEAPEPTITVVGCSGPSQGNYTYDAPAQDVELVITELDDGVRRAQLTATYVPYDYSGAGTTTQVTTAEFEYRTVR
jgi:hypothetical protein